MTLGELLETLIIGPLKLLFEWIFIYANTTTAHPGWAIVVLSIIMNILVLPLYRCADAIQEKVRDTETSLKAGVDHIKKSFTGDERMMILQTYYRQNNYKPIHSLKGSVSLFLQIPFFIAAYQFLSGLDLFEKVSFGPIPDLSLPDGLFVAGRITINVLPILMTIINLISCTIYLNKSTTKEKIQLYATALIFLVLLYNSPSCLVLYWTLNNLFSLGKNIILKKNILSPKESKHNKWYSTGRILEIIGIFVYLEIGSDLCLYLFYIGLSFQLPLIYGKLTNKLEQTDSPSVPVHTNQCHFILGMLFITILTGILIPSAYIAANPQEFIDISYFHNPLWYIVSSFCLAAGFFLIWISVFYYLLGSKVKSFLDKIVWIAGIIMLVNYMFFATNSGIISARLQYVTPYNLTMDEKILNMQVVAILVAILYVIVEKKKTLASFILLILTLTITVMSTMNIVTIQKSVDSVKLNLAENTNIPHPPLSTEGNNVIVIMLDRAMGAYIPYIFDERPELKSQFDGFTYYSNTISFGGATNFAAPALYGGYEYTPVEMNKRDTESLVDKHNEALKLMPAIFTENGYRVTVFDPPYANYQWIPDLSIYDDYPDIETYNTSGRFIPDEEKEAVIKNNYRNFFCFSLMKTAPLYWHHNLYDGGDYNRIKSKEEKLYHYEFRNAYSVLAALPSMTNITTEPINTFFILSNNLTHEPVLIDELSTPQQQSGSLEHNNRTLDLRNSLKLSHYQTNTAALMLLGNWFDYLRENNVYDNSRIIIVADHGCGLEQIDALNVSTADGSVYGTETYFPLLLVKDFGSNGFTTSDEFMTNADVPTLSMKNLIQTPINPFTQKPINSDEKSAHNQYIIMSGAYDFNIGSETPEYTYPMSKWACVSDNIWARNNWSLIPQEIILKEHITP